LPRKVQDIRRQKKRHERPKGNDTSSWVTRALASSIRRADWIGGSKSKQCAAIDGCDLGCQIPKRDGGLAEKIGKSRVGKSEILKTGGEHIKGAKLARVMERAPKRSGDLRREVKKRGGQ